jgi:hypothetical protein
VGSDAIPLLNASSDAVSALEQAASAIDDFDDLDDNDDDDDDRIIVKHTSCKHSLIIFFIIIIQLALPLL